MIRYYQIKQIEEREWQKIYHCDVVDGLSSFLLYVHRRSMSIHQLFSLFIITILIRHGDAATYPATYCIRFDTNIEQGNRSIIVNVTQSWAPLGANHLYDIINSQFYSVPSAFFRVVPNFVLQFGISGSPQQNVAWQTPIKDGKINRFRFEGSILFIFLLQRPCSNVKSC